MLFYGQGILELFSCEMGLFLLLFIGLVNVALFITHFGGDVISNVRKRMRASRVGSDIGAN